MSAAGTPAECSLYQRCCGTPVGCSFLIETKITWIIIILAGVTRRCWVIYFYVIKCSPCTLSTKQKQRRTVARLLLPKAKTPKMDPKRTLKWTWWSWGTPCGTKTYPRTCSWPRPFQWHLWNLWGRSGCWIHWGQTNKQIYWIIDIDIGNLMYKITNQFLKENVIIHL